MSYVSPIQKVYGAFTASPMTRKIMGKSGQMLEDVSRKIGPVSEEEAQGSLLTMGTAGTVGGGTALFGNHN